MMTTTATAEVNKTTAAVAVTNPTNIGKSSMKVDAEVAETDKHVEEFDSISKTVVKETQTKSEEKLD